MARRRFLIGPAFLLVGFLVMSLIVQRVTPAEAATCPDTSIRWASSSNIVYVTGPVACTLTEIAVFAPATALQLVDPVNHVWHLKANLKLEEGAALLLHGSSVGGDVDELRLRSNNSVAFGSTIWVRAQWGSLDIDSTRVVSWDDAVSGPDIEYATYARSYIHVRSFLDTDGVTARESRMDIANSEVSHLGHNGAEAYGLAWKVSGSGPELYDVVNVLGDVTNTYIHHNYFGAYTYGAFGMNWTGNEIADNVLYGLDPHDDSDYLVITGNLVRNNGNHGIICSQRCNNLVIRNNVSRDNTGNGIMLHRNTNNSLVENNDVYGNSDSGIAVFDSHNNVIRNNLSHNNSRGMRFSVGSSNNAVENNDISFNNSYGIYLYQGTDLPTINDGRPKFNTFTNNTIHDSGSSAVKLSDSDNNEFATNQFANNFSGILFVTGVSNRLDNNVMPSGMAVATNGSSTIAGSTIISTTMPVLVTVDSVSSVTFVDPNGRILDPEELGGAATVTTAGSTITLNSALIGLQSLVTPLDFWVTVPSGSTTVRPTTWETSGSLNRDWVTQATSPGQAANYVIGGLVPGGSYYALKGGAPLLTLLAASNGSIGFTDSVDTTAQLTYSVRQAPAGSPTSTPTPTSTETSTTTDTPTATPTSTATPASALDTDGDGCTDAQELGPDPIFGGDRNPLDPWDFYDVPVPALTAANPSGARNKVVTQHDALAVAYYAGTFDNGPPNTNGVDYDADLNNNGVEDGREYDRSPSIVPGKPWRSGPPNGSVTLNDALVANNQVGHSCAGAD